MKYVLFVCTHNAGRSQMAQALFERYAPEDIRAESAGQEPADQVWPNVVEAMAEIGIDLAGRRPKKLDLEMQLHADWAITLGCGGSCPYVPTVVEDWEIPDPAGLSLEATRPIRDLLERNVRELVEERIDAIRDDRTAHAMRLQRLLPSLVDEFGAEKSADEIRACVDQMLDPYDDVPVRSFVLTLARRNAEECLREGRCALDSVA
jgi:arsenate reductase (thioredoxin)